MNAPLLHSTVRAGSEKFRIWQICDELHAERGTIPAGKEVAERYAAEGGNLGTGYTQYSHWKNALQERLDAESGPPNTPAEPGSVAFRPMSISADGTLVLPADIRRAMALDPDGRVTVCVVDGELRVVSPLASLHRAQALASRYKKPGESVVDEFLADRRSMWGED